MPIFNKTENAIFTPTLPILHIRLGKLLKNPEKCEAKF